MKTKHKTVKTSHAESRLNPYELKIRFSNVSIYLSKSKKPTNFHGYLQKLQAELEQCAIFVEKSCAKRIIDWEPIFCKGQRVMYLNVLLKKYLLQICSLACEESYQRRNKFKKTKVRYEALLFSLKKLLLYSTFADIYCMN